MRLKINKAYDLSSISVFPPHSRRSNPSSLAADPLVLGKMQPSQLRSQSQHSSQGLPLSQLSQSSFEDIIPSEQMQREDSQMVTRTSNNMIQRLCSSSASERKCQMSEELEQRFGFVENNLSRFGMILESMQNDVMQINKTTKEVMLEVESIRQKAVIHDNSLQLMMKAEEEIRSSIDRSFKFSLEKKDEPDKNSYFQEINSSLSKLPDEIESRMSTLCRELFNVVTKQVKKSEHDKSSLEEVISLMAILPGQIQSRISTLHKEFFTVLAKEIKAVAGCWRPPVQPTFDKKQGPVTPRKNIATWTQIKTQPAVKPKPEVIVLSEQERDSDGEMDGAFSCLLVEKKIGEGSYFIEEAKQESMRILRKARRRKRKLDNIIILH